MVERIIYCKLQSSHFHLNLSFHDGIEIVIAPFYPYKSPLTKAN